jgi:hypothetical protein
VQQKQAELVKGKQIDHQQKAYVYDSYAFFFPKIKTTRLEVWQRKKQSLYVRIVDMSHPSGWENALDAETGIQW